MPWTMTGVLRPPYDPGTQRERAVRWRRGALTGDPLALYELGKSGLAGDLCNEYCRGQVEHPSSYCTWLACSILFDDGARFTGVYPHRPTCPPEPDTPNKATAADGTGPSRNVETVD